MSKIARFVIWICSKFTRIEIEQIITRLLDVLNNRNPEVKLKDDFKEKHPNYRIFSVDPLPPLTEPPIKPHKKPNDYKLLLSEYQIKHGKPLSPVKYRSVSQKVPNQITCPLCNAPHIYIYYNNGNKRSQLKCKLCGHIFQLNQCFRKNDKPKYFCPYCHHALFMMKPIIDGNPSYPAGIHFINSQSNSNSSIKHHKVIGLQNLDKESEEFRPFK